MSTGIVLVVGTATSVAQVAQVALAAIALCALVGAHMADLLGQALGA